MILTDDEYKILFSIKKENKYKWIVREKNGQLLIFTHKPCHIGMVYEQWASDEEHSSYDILNYCDLLFKYIEWTDAEPYNIEELLK